MEYKRLTIAVIILITIAGCSTPPTPTPTPPATASPQAGFLAGSAVAAKGEIAPIKKVQLSFPMVGLVQTVAVAENDAVREGQALIILDTTILDAKAAQAEADLRGAQAEFNYKKRTGTGREFLEAAQSEVDRAGAALTAARAEQAQATLLAPFDATVTLIDVSPGEIVVPGQVVIVLGDLSRLQVETTDLSERDTPQVEIGQPAVVYIEALGQEINGKVTEVARQSTIVSGDVFYKVTIQLDEQPENLRWGMSVEVEIQTEE